MPRHLEDRVSPNSRHSRLAFCTKCGPVRSALLIGRSNSLLVSNYPLFDRNQAKLWPSLSQVVVVGPSTSVPLRIAHFTVTVGNEAGVDLVFIQPSLLYYVNHVFVILNSIFFSKIYIRKGRRSVSKQCHPQPHVHSKARTQSP